MELNTGSTKGEAMDTATNQPADRVTEACRTILYRRAAVALAQLPTTPRLIAAELRRHGVQGACGDAHACALAAYLEARIGAKVAIGSSSALVHLGIARIDVTLPQNVAIFVYAFDCGDYPELIGTPTPGDVKELGNTYGMPHDAVVTA